MRKMFYEVLPRRGKFIDWMKSIGYKVKFIYDDIEGEVEIIGCFYQNGKPCLYIKQQGKEPFKILTSLFQNCNLGKLLSKKTNEFKIEIGQIFKDDKRDIVIIDRNYIKDKQGRNWKYYKYKCNKCGFECGEHYRDGGFKEELWIEESNLLQGKGCACCCNPMKIVVQGINDIPTTAPWMVKFFQGGYDEAKLYSKSSGQPIYPKCPDCGRVKDKEVSINNIYQKKSIGCNSCSDGFSYGHKYIFRLLSEFNLEFKENIKFDWCKFYNPFKEKETYGEYDFVIEDVKLIIEVDGNFHRTDNKMSGQTKEHSKYLDDMKDKLANENRYKVIRVSDEDGIKDNIFNSDLVEIFDLSNIDWLKIEEFAMSNRIKETCELKRDNPDMTTVEIGKIMKINRTTIKDYLKKGSKIWDWINYDPNEEKLKGSSRSGKMNGKQVEMFKDGISLGIFESCLKLERRSEKLFGIRLLQGSISAVCTGRQKHHRGYQFKYV